MPAGQRPVFGANVLMLVYGDAFWPTYTDGRQYRPGRHRLDEELHPARDAELRRRRSGGLLPVPGETFLDEVPAGRRHQVSAVEIPYDGLERQRRRSRPAVPNARRRASRLTRPARRRSGVRHSRVQAAAARRQRVHGFVRDEYTTLPDMHESAAAHVARSRMAATPIRPTAFSDGAVDAARARRSCTTCSRRSSRAASSR